MKKAILFFAISFSFLFLISGIVQAQGIVPCGRYWDPTIVGPPPPGHQRCELNDLFRINGLIYNVYYFIIWNIATPLAGLGIVIGGVMLILSAGNPGLAGRAKQILWGSILGIVLMWGAWLIINTVFLAIGYI